MKKANWLLICSGIGIAGLIAYRAYAIPFTHDESSTWLNLRYENIWGCFFDPGCWATANNHWLNTILLQLCGTIGGEQPWVLRIPNILAGWSYLLVAGLIMQQYLENQWTQWFGFLLVTLQFYLLDFFSLARGYGLMVAGIYWAVYCLLRYSEKTEIKWLAWTLLSLFLALLANFTAFIATASVLGVWLFFLVGNRRYDLLWNHGRLILLFCAVCVVLFRIPIIALSESGEFAWGAAGIGAMGKGLFAQLVNSASYLSISNFETLFWLTLAAIAASLIILISQYRVRPAPQLALTFLLTGFVLLTIVLHQLITDGQAPDGRKSIFLIPVLFTPLALSLDFIRRKTVATIVGVLGSLFLIFHFSSIFKNQIKSTREWYYDAYYHELLSSVLPGGVESDSVALGTVWIFVPSLEFYQKSQALPLSGLAYHKELVIDTTMDYYYVSANDTTGFAAHSFVVDKPIGPFLLCKRLQPGTLEKPE